MVSAFLQRLSEAGAVTQWYSVCLTCIRPWVQTPAPTKKGHELHVRWFHSAN